MTGKFTLKDPVRCAHYARFFQHLTLTEANILYWFLFVFVLVLMCISSIQHHKSNNLTAEFSKAGSSTPRQTRRLRRRRLHYLSIASLCFILALICVVLEVFAAFNIEYCDGEDLIQLYWGFWSILQVGSLIAILGVMLQFWIVLGNVQTPSWAVALGTPVLVFAALGYIFRHIGKSWICRKSSIESEDDTDVEKGSSEENEDAEENAKDEEKTGSWAARWITWAPEDQLMRERNEDSLDRVRTMRSGDCSDMEFASRATTIYTPGQPGDVRRTSTY
ncbi:hypothetical protein sscle_12g086950 [Sclerotinia sclerotiorum 1980 UF-70]|uniref:Uncharacterized protein n=1 Tax=Sclerotinia sclerotiorum (strain ATCC 18683 / 1980 / Ss-1) TaxID=665079 RepID=A0A1D9QG66_SCLS1|nr:hypothetical protein sscle_12g086950 [Sclerotinia sclerotiorum 1980 UF-70]